MVCNICTWLDTLVVTTVMDVTALSNWVTDASPTLVPTVLTSCVRSAWLAFSSTALPRAATSDWVAFSFNNPISVVPIVASLLIAVASSFSVSSVVTAPTPTSAPIAEFTSLKLASALTLIPALSADCTLASDTSVWCCPLTAVDSAVDTDAVPLCRTDPAVETVEDSAAPTDSNPDTAVERTVDMDVVPLCRAEIAAVIEPPADKLDRFAAVDRAASAVEMDATPLARSETVDEMPADVALCVLLADEMTVDTPLDTDAAWLVRSDTADEMPTDSDASASCSVEAAVDRDDDTEATAPVAGAPDATNTAGSADTLWIVRRVEGALNAAFSRTIRREPSIMMPVLVPGRVISAIVLLLPNNPPTKAPMEAPPLPPVKKIAPFWLVDALRAPNKLPSTYK